MSDAGIPAGSRGAWSPGVVVTLAVGLVLMGLAVSVDFPRVARGFKGDEATYYSLAHSLARDFDFTFERRDLVRVWEEFPAGPEGIFLKRGTVLDVGLTGRFPFVSWEARQDPRWEERLYYGKAYIYPLVAAPFVLLFGTNGFLVLHAILMALNVWLAYLFLSARSPEGPAAAYAALFFFASAVPIYVVWLTPELFNLSVSLYALFLWSYKEVAPQRREEGGRWADRSRFLRGPGSDYLAAVLLGIVTFSKPTHLVLILPLLALAALRREWRRATAMGAIFGTVLVALFAVNVAITGELNYQGGDRKTFYGLTEFPFLNERANFETAGQDRATDTVLVDVLFTRDALLGVLPWNIVYFLLGRHHGLVPYFFPGVLSAVLFLLAWRERQTWQWLVAGTAVLSALAVLVYMPYTYSGGGGPVANRYFLAFYPLLLFLTPSLGSPVPAIAAAGVGSLFTAQLLLNPFHVSFNPGDHPKRGPYRLLPVELSLVNDLPVSAWAERARRSLGGTPPIQAYFLDDNAFNPEGDWFWVRGASRTEVMLRAPADFRRADGEFVPLPVERFELELRNGPFGNRVTLKTGRETRRLALEGGQAETVSLDVPRGFPYKPAQYPTNYVYLVSIASEAGFVPHFVAGSPDARFLGVMVRIVPVYAEQP